MLAAALLALLSHAVPAIAPPHHSAADTLPSPGVAQALARERAARVSGLRYAVRLAIPADVHAPIAGEETIRFRVTQAGTALALDFQHDSSSVSELEVNGARAAYRVGNGHVVLGAHALRRGENSVHIRFIAGDAPLNRNPDYLYTLFVPARASLALPVFDQPDLKGRFTLTLELPAAWRYVANSPEVARTVSGGRQTVRFAETKPLPTYLFAFVAGAWQVETATRGGRTIRLFHRETDAAKVARNRDSIFDLVTRSIRYMERYTGIPYPFPKYDLVLVPSFQFGGMEHPGQILYNASSLMLDETATQNQKLGRASVIAHETAHMWFGDLVTMRWFDDVWMKEVFANFMAAKIVNPSFPEINHELRFLLAHYPAAYAVDRSAGTHPIRQRLDNLSEAGQLYGAIIYEKAPIVMRMLEELVGPETFRRGADGYLRAHEFGNASWPDLIDVLDRLAPARHLKAWSHVWVEEAGRPTLKVEVKTSPAGSRREELAGLTIRQSDPAGRGRVWTQPATVALVYGDSARKLPAFLDAPAVAVAGARRRRAPDFVLPNGGGRAYGRMELEGASWSALLRALPTLRDPLVRGGGWLDAWDALLDGEIAPTAFMAAALRGIEGEADEQLAERILAYTGDAYWHFLSAPERAACARGLEALLWRRLASVAGTSRKSAYFSALRSVATTPATVQRLRRVWARDTTIPGLPLAEQDYTTLALELAVRGVPDGDSILAAQEVRIQNPDRKARLAFVRPALSADPTVRDAWFAALRDPANRRHEPWVLEGLTYLDHPLRQADSEKYIRPALDLLAEVRRTGDIFFPGRWVGAVLSGHTTPVVAATVRAFLAEHPDYPQRLRELVLQGADELFRAAAVVGHGPSAAAPLWPGAGEW